MPHTTHAYPFEAKVGQFAGELSARFSSGSVPRSFLLTLDQLGNVVSLVFEGKSSSWHRRVQEMEESAVPHVFYDPLEDGMEYIWLSWHGIQRTIMERLLGEPFTSTDFEPLPLLTPRVDGRIVAGQYPSSWGVMF